MVRIKVAKVKEVKEGKAKLVNVNGKQIALFNINGEFFAIDNECLHKGGPLCDGEIDGNIVTCPWHGWKYDIKTGHCVFPPANLKTKSYSVEVKGGEIFIEI